VERYEIEAFLTLAEELHFGRSAERLNISTAAVSQAIRRLERRVGASLFDRTSRRVALTALGRQFRDELAPAHRQVEAAFSHAVEAGRGFTGTLRVGFVGPAAGQLSLHAADRFGADYPDTEVRVREMHLGDALDRLQADQVEILFACLPARKPGLVTGPVLFSEPRLLAVGTGHPLARRKSVSVEDLAQGPIPRASCSIPDHWDDPGHDRRTPAGRPIRSGPRAETLEEVLALVGAGKGIFPVGQQVARFHARPDVAYVAFRDAPPLDWAPIWRAGHLTARIQAFCAAARAEVADKAVASVPAG
jgi:DNA-binding transcriptional LysR family regulator